MGRRKQDNLEGEVGKSDVHEIYTTFSHLQKGPTWTKPFPASTIKYPTCKVSDVLSYGRRVPPPAPRTQKATPVHRVADATLAWNNGTFLLMSSSSASWAPLCKHNFKTSNSMSLSLAAVCSSLKDSS